MRSTLQYMSYLFIFSMLIDQGDSRWKERNKRNASEMLTYKKIADNLSRDFEKFYDQYPGWAEDEHLDLNPHIINSLKPTITKINKNEIQNLFSPVVKTNQELNVTILYGKTPFNINTQNSSKNHRPSTYRPKFYEKTTAYRKNQNSSKDEQPKAPWPKFDDILLDMGKKYDWKNDRWLKVKVIPINQTNTKSKRHKNNEKNIHESKKHFIYKMVKLLKPNKIRRNLVVAVSAVR